MFRHFVSNIEPEIVFSLYNHKEASSWLLSIIFEKSNFLNQKKISRSVFDKKLKVLFFYFCSFWTLKSSPGSKNWTSQKWYLEVMRTSPYGFKAKNRFQVLCLIQNDETWYSDDFVYKIAQKIVLWL